MSLSSPLEVVPVGAAHAPASTRLQTARRLCFDDFASLTMGIEVHHRRVDAVFAHFGLLTSGERRAEELAWIAYLRSNPTALARLRRQREDARAEWIHWAPSASGGVAVREPRRPYRAPLRFRPAEVDAPLDLLAELALREPLQRARRLVLVEYASLRMLLDETPHLHVQHGAAFGLSSAELDEEVATWAAVLAEQPGQAESCDRIRAELESSRARPSTARASSGEPIAAGTARCGRETDF